MSKTPCDLCTGSMPQWWETSHFNYDFYFVCREVNMGEIAVHYIQWCDYKQDENTFLIAVSFEKS